MKTRKLALILALMLMLMLVLIVPVTAQDATPEATIDAIAPVGIEVTMEATEEATVEAAVVSETAAVEEVPVAGIAEEAEEDATKGASLLVLLVGLAAVGIVGFGTYMRQSYKPPQE